MKKYLIYLVGAALIIGICAVGLSLKKQSPNSVKFLGNADPRLTFPVISAVAATSSGAIIDPQDYSSATCSLDVDSIATATIKFAGSVSETAPNFLTAASSTNSYDYLEITDLQDGSLIDGDTGISVTTTQHRLFRVDVNALSWFTAVVSSYTTGTISSVGCRLSNED